MSEITRPVGGGLTAMRWYGPLLVFAGGVCIGFAPIGLRLGLDELGPQAIAFWRYAFAVPVLFFMVLAVKRRLPAPPNAAVLLAGVFFTLDIALWHWALERTSVANATFLVNLGNVCVGLVAWLVLRERPTLFWFIAVPVAIAGAAMLSLGGAPDGVTDWRGDLLALGAAVLVSLYMLCAKMARGNLGGLDVIFWLTLTETGVGALVVLAAGESFLPATLVGFAAPLFLALAVQIGGQGLIVTGLGHTPAAIAGVLVLVQPVTAAIISALLFGEILTGLQGAGAFLILVAVLLAQRTPRRPAASLVAQPTQTGVKPGS